MDYYDLMPHQATTLACLTLALATLPGCASLAPSTADPAVAATSAAAPASATRAAPSPEPPPPAQSALTARLKDDYAAFLAAGKGEKAGKTDAKIL